MINLTSSFGLDSVKAAALHKIGPRLDPQMIADTRAIFEGSWDLSLPDGGVRTADIPYGEHSRHRLDLYSPGVPDRPILLFVHGGGFVAGDKRAYEHLGFYFARAGFLTALISYRLAPDHTWPAGAEDVSAALDWIAQNAQAYGGDVSRIVVLGQSAGAAHCSGALFDRRFRPRCYPSVRALMLMSGLYEMRVDLNIGGPLAYFGDDASKYPDRSPLNHVEIGGIRTLLTLAELDPPFIVRSVFDLANALGTHGGTAPFAWLEGHNHLSPLLSVGSTGDTLGPSIAQALRDTRARSA